MKYTFVQRRLASWLQRATSTSGVRRVAPLHGALASEIGNNRDDNQDKAIIFRGSDASGRPYAVAVVADGIGGMKDGAVCASLAIASFTSAFSELSLLGTLPLQDRLLQSVMFSNEAVHRDYLGRGGSTLVAVVLTPGRPPIWASAGDSRIYLLSNQTLKPLTVDDTIAGQLDKKGRVSPEHSKILQYIGMGRNFEPHIGEVGNASEGQLVLTTDGVHYLAEDGSDWFKNVLQHASEVWTAAKRLVDVATWCGGPDNATLAVISFPVQFSDIDSEETDLQIWDAFGELHVQLEYSPSVRFNVGGQSLENEPALSVREDIEENDSPELLEDEAPTGAKPTKRKSSRKKAKSNPKSRKSSDGTKSPQLDIQFSTESKD